MAKTIVPMTEGPIWKRITYFALPLFFGNLFQQMYNTVDSLIVGNFLGSNALAAVSSSSSLIFMLIGLFSGLSSGAGVIISRYFGAKNIDSMQRSIHTTVAAGLIAGIILTIIGVGLSPQILVLMSTPPAVMTESVAYLQVYFAGSLGFVMYNVFVGILQAVGDSRHPLYYLIVSSIVNLVLDVVFIRNFHMGVDGAALATIISQFISALLCLFQLMGTAENFRLRLKEIRIDRSILLQIVHLGLPSGIQNSIVAFANVVVQSNINAFGEMAMAGFGAYSKIEGFGFLPITSFTMALTTFISQNLGARQYERVKKGTRFGIVTIVVLSELIGLGVFLLAPQLIAAFDSTPEVVEFGILKARTAAPFFFLVACTHSFAAVLRGAGKTMVSMVVLISTWCVIRVAFLSITIPLTHSIQMVCLVYPLTWFLSSLALFIYYRKADWIHSSLDKESSSPHEN